MKNKLLGYGFAAFLIWFIVTRPGPAATLLKGIGSGLVVIANGLGSFVTNLT